MASESDKQPKDIRFFNREDTQRMRDEMWNQLAPATEMPARARRPKRARAVKSD